MLSLLTCEVGIAGTHGEAIRLPYRWADANLNWKAEVAHHLFDHEGLLPVFRTKIGSIGGDSLKQSADDRRHPAEMSWSQPTLKRFGWPGDLDAGGIAGGIHLGSVWCEYPADLLLAEQLAVSGKVTGIAVEVFVGTELSRIDVNRDNNVITVSQRLVHQAGVTGMQTAHGRDKADPPTSGPGGKHLGTNCTACMNHRRAGRH